MRILMVAESFLPHVNGVSGSVIRALTHAHARGHDVSVLAAGHHAPTIHPPTGAPIHHIPSIGMPGYPQVRVAAVTQRRVGHLLDDVRPDVVHLASPFVLGHTAGEVARYLRIPVVAVFQTDVAAFARHYGVPRLGDLAWRRLTSIHGAADRTLAPTHTLAEALRQRGIPGVHVWGRGVDGQQFHPERRSEELRRQWAPGGERIVGYLGRLAPEKQVEDLAAIQDLPGNRLVIVGDGPSRGHLERRLPGAVFLGHLEGPALGAAVASMDVMVHPGESETFGQAVQEALAAGVPVIAPAVGGPLELIDHSRTGWLYPPGRLDELRRFTVDLAADDAKRRAFSVAARASVLPRTWEVLGDELLGHYADVVSATASAAVRPGQRERVRWLTSST